jgi:hypothetical protein
MTHRALTDSERIASIREVIEAARGDWHEATSLLSVCADLHWLLNRAEPWRQDAAAFYRLSGAVPSDLTAEYERVTESEFPRATGRGRGFLEGIAFTQSNPLDVERLAAAIRANWYEIRPSGGSFVRPIEAAESIAAEYARLAASPDPTP